MASSALNELRDFYFIFIKNPTGWPTTAATGGLWSNQSLNTTLGNSVSNTGMSQVNIDNTQKHLQKIFAVSLIEDMRLKLLLLELIDEEVYIFP